MSDSTDAPLDADDLAADRFKLECPDGCGTIRFVVSATGDADYWCAECGTGFGHDELRAANDAEGAGEIRTDGGQCVDGTERLGLQTTECWRCGKQRYIYESCHHCGGSCKPLKAEKQRKEDAATDRGDRDV